MFYIYIDCTCYKYLTSCTLLIPILHIIHVLHIYIYISSYLYVNVLYLARIVAVKMFDWHTLALNSHFTIYTVS